MVSVSHSLFPAPEVVFMLDPRNTHSSEGGKKKEDWLELPPMIQFTNENVANEGPDSGGTEQYLFRKRKEISSTVNTLK